MSTTKDRATYTVRCVRDDGWWIVTVDELNGVFTHAKRLDQIDDLVRDAIALWLEAPADSFAIERVVELPPQAKAPVDAAARARAELLAAKADVANRTVLAVTELSRSGMSTRDVGTIIGVSHQRVAQLLAEAGVKS